MIAPLIAVCAFALPPSEASAKDEAKSPATLNQPLKWHKVGKDGRREELAKSPANGPKASAVFKKPDGSAGTRQISPALRLTGDAYYVAELPDAVRSDPLFVDFSISGTAGSTPDQGSIINVDGAVIGFQLRPGVDRADVMVLDIGSDGQPIWHKAGWGLPIDPTKHITASPRMAVRLDHKNVEWSLYANDVLVMGGLPLLAAKDKGAPAITLKAGPVDSDTLVLKRIRIGVKPSGRGKEFLPAGPDGWIDFAKARTENDLRLGPVSHAITKSTSANRQPQEPKQ